MALDALPRLALAGVQERNRREQQEKDNIFRRDQLEERKRQFNEQDANQDAALASLDQQRQFNQSQITQIEEARALHDWAFNADGSRKHFSEIIEDPRAHAFLNSSSHDGIFNGITERNIVPHGDGFAIAGTKGGKEVAFSKNRSSDPDDPISIYNIDEMDRFFGAMVSNTLARGDMPTLSQVDTVRASLGGLETEEGIANFEPETQELLRSIRPPVQEESSSEPTVTENPGDTRLAELDKSIKRRTRALEAGTYRTAGQKAKMQKQIREMRRERRGLITSLESQDAQRFAGVTAKAFASPDELAQATAGVETTPADREQAVAELGTKVGGRKDRINHATRLYATGAITDVKALEHYVRKGKWQKDTFMNLGNGKYLDGDGNVNDVPVSGYAAVEANLKLQKAYADLASKDTANLTTWAENVNGWEKGDPRAKELVGMIHKSAGMFSMRFDKPEQMNPLLHLVSSGMRAAEKHNNRWATQLFGDEVSINSATPFLLGTQAGINPENFEKLDQMLYAPIRAAFPKMPKENVVNAIIKSGIARAKAEGISVDQAIAAQAQAYQSRG